MLQSDNTIWNIRPRQHSKKSRTTIIVFLSFLQFWRTAAETAPYSSP